MFAFTQRDNFKVWRTQTFRIYEGGRWWRPPPCEAALEAAEKKRQSKFSSSGGEDLSLQTPPPQVPNPATAVKAARGNAVLPAHWTQEDIEEERERYYFLYRGVYRAQMRAKSEDFIMTTLVTISASVGNIIINQIVWSSAMDVGYRFKADRDAYVFRWYSVITLINTVFNFGVITTTYSKKPEDHLQRVLYESALGHQLSVFIRGSLISYAIFPVFYILLWLKGRVMLLWEYCASKHRDHSRLRLRYNCRYYHGFASEDFIGQVKEVCASSYALHLNTSA
eukprot:g12258.t1